MHLLRVHSGAIVLTAILSAASFFMYSTPAEAGHTMQGGTCWKSGTPLLCRTTWAQNQWMPVRTYDAFSDARPGWWQAFEDHVWAWNAAPGLQNLHWVPQQNETWVFYQDSQTGQNGLTAGKWAVAWNCGGGGGCTNQPVAFNIWYSNVYLNRDITFQYAELRWLFAHETGHALGLNHHLCCETTYLMYEYYNGVVAPQQGDIGNMNCTGSYFYWGYRCIYKW